MTQRSLPVEITGPQGMLEGIRTTPVATRFVSVVGHPHPLYGGSMDNLVVLDTESALLEAGVEVTRFNFRGVGRSDGEHDRGSGERRDLLAAVRNAREAKPGLPLVLAGYSFGAAMAMATLPMKESREQPPGGLLLLAPPITHYDFSSLDDFNGPIEILWGEADVLTPAARISELESLLGQAEFRCIPGAGHDLGTFSNPMTLRAALAHAAARLAPGH